MKLSITHEARITLATFVIIAFSCILMHLLFAQVIYEANNEMWGKYLATFDIQNLKDYSALKINFLGLYVALAATAVSTISAIFNAVLWFRQSDYNRSRDQRNDERDRKDKIQTENQMTITFRNEVIRAISNVKYVEDNSYSNEVNFKTSSFAGEESLMRFADKFEYIFGDKINLEDRSSAKSTSPDTASSLIQIALLLEAFIVQAVKFEDESLKFAHAMIITSFSSIIYDACSILNTKAREMRTNYSDAKNAENIEVAAKVDFEIALLRLDQIIKSTDRIGSINSRFRSEYLSRKLSLTEGF